MKKKDIKQKLISGAIHIISIFPFGVLYLLSDFLYLIIYKLIGYRKAVVLENLRNSFPEKSDSEIKNIANKFYKYLPDLIIEAIKMKSISAKSVMQRIELLNPEEIYRYLDAGRPVIGVTAHYCNWELGLYRLSLMTDVPQLVIYKPLSNKSFNTTINRTRSRFGATLVPMKQILRYILPLRTTPHISMFVADQTPGYQDSDYFMPFLGQDTLVYTGVDRIAKKTNIPVVFCEIRRKPKRGYYTCRFITLSDNPRDTLEQQITQIYMHKLESIIKSEPEYWLWSHRRWKRKRRSHDT